MMIESAHEEVEDLIMTQLSYAPPAITTTGSNTFRVGEEPSLPSIQLSQFPSKLSSLLFVYGIGLTLVLITTWFIALHYLWTTPKDLLSLSPALQEFSHSTSSSSVAAIFITSFISISLILLLFLTRLGTFRELQSNQFISGRLSLFGRSNHRETDEVIFEALTHAVIHDISDYSLRGKSIIQELRLSVDNYSDRLFIHPPFFVYLSAFLHSYVGLSLPTIPVLFYFITIMMIPIIVHYILRDDCFLSNIILPNQSVSSYYYAALKAVVVMMCCPIAAFCSQKYWIDNALMMTVTVAVAAHMILTDPQIHGISNMPSLVCHSISGLIFFGGLAMNTKVTALALLPFLLLWIVYQRLGAAYRNLQLERMKWWLNKDVIFIDILLHLFIFVASTVVGHLPWLLTYWFFTGRWTPNAWPSQEMLRNSPFVRAAVDKPMFTYITTLLQVAPIHLYGLLFCAVVIPLYILSRTIYTNCTFMWKKSDVKGSTVTEGHVRDCSSPDPTSSSEIPLYEHFLLTKLCILSTWPTAFLVGLTIIGSFGSGFQARFLLPIVPATASLSAIVVSVLQAQLNTTITTSVDTLNGRTIAVTFSIVVFDVMVVVSAFHCLFYGVLFAPLFADLDVSVWDLLSCIWKNPLSMPTSHDSWLETVRFLKHFGLNR
mmetsp:Transcript_31093/g.44663  ORF Transcript_31093/g.44663 Transcript_31093/m.44663 type:complete len:657 (-) Transcript_31093:28-1998(-)